MKPTSFGADDSHTDYFKELYRFRELFLFFTWKDLIVHYKQTFLSLLWILIRPLLTVFIFVFIFGKVAGLATTEIPYPLFVLSGMLPWQFITSSVSQAATSLIDNKQLITKVYFPRMIIPASVLCVYMIDLLILTSLFLAGMAYCQIPFTVKLLTLPLFAVAAFLFSLGVSLWLSALCIRFRDVRILLPFLIQLGLFLSPIAYSVEMIPLEYRWLYALNPMVGIIEGVRWAAFGDGENLFPVLAAGFSVIAVVLATGYGYFRREEALFADII